MQNGSVPEEQEDEDKDKTVRLFIGVNYTLKKYLYS